MTTKSNETAAGPADHAAGDLLLDPDALRSAALELGEVLAGYEAELAGRPVFPDIDRKVIRTILEEPFPEDGRPLRALLDEFRSVVIPNSTQIAHPRFLAYVLPSPNGISPFADALASVVNQNCNLWTLSPAANAIERKVISWFLELFEIPEGGGILTSGGSMANLSALAVARDSRHPGDPRREGLQGVQSPLVLYTSEEAHYSIDKAAALLGLGLNNVRHIGTDDGCRLRLDLLRHAVAEDRRAGKTPFCVVGSAGTVTAGAIDPLDELADYCGREDLWLHVDGAYGAFAVLSERLRPRLLGSGRGDSLTLDPHKLLFASLEAGCVLFRDEERWRGTFSFVPHYLAMNPDPDLLHFAEYGPQLSRSFKALKVWWAIRAYGRKAYVRVIDNLLDLASYMGERVRSEPRLELAAPVTLTAVCFLHRELDAAGHEQVVRDLTAGGLAFLGPARVKGRPCIRACFTNLRTTRRDIDLILDEILRLADRSLPAPADRRDPT
jgi:aromatic-L-amino-acid decarboxylase